MLGRSMIVRLNIAVKVSQQQMRQDYQSENQQLRELQRERLARQQAQAFNVASEKQIKLDRQQKQQLSHNPDLNIWLNTLVYDDEPHKRKYTLSLANLLHQDVHSKPIKAASPNIESLMISTYGYQMEVIAPILTMGFPVFIINRDNDTPEGYVSRKQNDFSNFTLISPPKVKAGYGVFHTKLWLIKFKHFLRVVICTSNNHLMDWAMWQNAYWYHDCPIRTISEASQSEATEGFDNKVDFPETLEWVIMHMQPLGFSLLNQLKIKLSEYSWKGIEPVLIPSISGSHSGKNLNKIGINKLRYVIRKSNSTIKNPTITCSCSSLGRVSEPFIAEMYQCFAVPLHPFAAQRFKLIYPTREYIEKRSCGQTQVLWYSLQDFIRCDIKNTLFHRYEPSSNGVQGTIPHLKTIIAEDLTNKDCILFVGSHNLTKAAWGTSQKNGTIISCSNDELGLLFLKYPKDLLAEWLPFEFPPAKYSQNDVPFSNK